MSVAAVSTPPFRAVAAMDRASMRATAAIWPLPGLEPSRLAKFRVAWRMERVLLAGVSPAPKQGPQKAGFITHPASMSLAAAPFLVTAREMGVEEG